MPAARACWDWPATHTPAFPRCLPTRLSWPQPLPTGRLLTEADVGPALQGRQAELYWPDDAKWYLIQFNAIYLDQRKAE